MWERVILVAALAAGGCGTHADVASAPAVPAGWTAHHDATDALRVRFPSAWQLARESLTPRLEDPKELVSLGTFPLIAARGPCAHLPAGALRRMRARDVFLTVQESGGSPRGFPPRPRPFRLGRASSEIAACLGRRMPFVDHWTAFRDGGRGFYVLTAIGRAASPQRRRALRAVLDSLQFDAAPGVRRMDPDASVPFDHNGIAGLLPRAWRLERRALTAAVGAGAQLAFGSFRVPHRPRNRNCTPRAAIDALPARGVFVFAFEYTDLTAQQLARFPARPLRFRLGRRQPYECFGESHLVRWQERGRALQAHVYLGRRAGAAGRRTVLAVLDGLRVGPRPGPG